MERIRRTRVAPVVELPPARVTRTRNIVKESGTRVRRTRTASVDQSHIGDPRKRFMIDWGRSLGWKLQIYLISSFLYYNMNRSVITDSEFDRLCNELADGWDTFSHPHKKCTSKSDMIAGTGYANKYPLIVQGAADCILREFHEV